MKALLLHAWRGQPVTADEAERLLNPSAWELADLLFNIKTGEVWAGFGYVLRGVRNVLLWAFWGLVDVVKRATAEKDPARFSHYQVPEYWLPEKGKTETITVEDFEVRGGGFPIGFGKNGLEYSEPETKSDVRAIKEAEKMREITRREVDVLAQYDPPLHNVALARKVKTYLQDGKTDKEIAALTGYAATTVKHYRLALEKAGNDG